MLDFHLVELELEHRTSIPKEQKTSITCLVDRWFHNAFITTVDAGQRARPSKIQTWQAIGIECNTFVFGEDDFDFHNDFHAGHNFDFHNKTEPWWKEAHKQLRF